MVYVPLAVPAGTVNVARPELAIPARDKSSVLSNSGMRRQLMEYAQASTIPLFKSLAGPLRNVRLTLPEVVGVQVKVVDVPAVIVKPGGVVGGFDVDPDCAATAAIRHATIESGEMRIMNVTTRKLCIIKRRDQKREREREGERECV